METGFCTRPLGTEQQAEDESSEQCVGGSGSVSAAGQRQLQGAQQMASVLMRGGPGGPVAAEPRGMGAWRSPGRASGTVLCQQTLPLPFSCDRPA